jgi:murein DD-endopeptidase MepM/ murein hydrolase activator NlpD
VGFLELTGASRHGSGNTRHPSFALLLALAVATLAIGAPTLAGASAATGSPHPTDMRCIDGCAGRQTAAVGSTIAIAGYGLANVSAVDFRGRSGPVAATPTATGRHRVTVEIPSGALGGRPRVVTQGGRSVRVPKLLRIVSQTRLPGRDRYDVLDTEVGPKHGFVDDGRSYRLRYRFRAYGGRTVRVRLIHSGDVARSWKSHGLLPYTAHRIEWRGLLSNGRPAPPGRYRFQIKSPHHKPVRAGRFRMFSGKFPVRGPHGYGGPVQRFAAPRSGGRVHQGQDVFAPCGTRVVAARGGRVQARGSDPVLYGNWVVIDARGTRTDYRYAHFLHPASVHQGERVRTGDDVGLIGKTGNARSVGCMLHFEVWPHGWNHGNPIDPLPILKRWDGWS